MTPALQAAIGDADIQLGGIIPSDPLVTEYDADGRPLVGLPEGSAMRQAVDEIVRRTMTV